MTYPSMWGPTSITLLASYSCMQLCARGGTEKPSRSWGRGSVRRTLSCSTSAQVITDSTYKLCRDSSLPILISQRYSSWNTSPSIFGLNFPRIECSFGTNLKNQKSTTLSTSGKSANTAMTIIHTVQTLWTSASRPFASGKSWMTTSSGVPKSWSSSSTPLRRSNTPTPWWTPSSPNWIPTSSVLSQCSPPRTATQRMRTKWWTSPFRFYWRSVVTTSLTISRTRGSTSWSGSCTGCPNAK